MTGPWPTTAIAARNASFCSSMFRGSWRRSQTSRAYWQAKTIAGFTESARGRAARRGARVTDACRALHAGTLSRRSVAARRHGLWPVPARAPSRNFAPIVPTRSEMGTSFKRGCWLAATFCFRRVSHRVGCRFARLRRQHPPGTIPAHRRQPRRRARIRADIAYLASDATRGSWYRHARQRFRGRVHRAPLRALGLTHSAPDFEQQFVAHPIAAHNVAPLSLRDAERRRPAAGSRPIAPRSSTSSSARTSITSADRPKVLSIPSARTRFVVVRTTMRRAPPRYSSLRASSPRRRRDGRSSLSPSAVRRWAFSAPSISSRTARSRSTAPSP